MKIRTRLTLWFTLLVTFLYFVSAVISWIGIRKNINQSLMSEALNKASEVQNIIYFLAKEYKDKKVSFKIEDPNIFLYTLSGSKSSVYDGVFLQMSTMRNQIFARSPNLNDLSLPVLDINKIAHFELKLPNDKNIAIFYYSTEVYFSDMPVAKLQIGLPMTQSENFLNQLILYNLIELIIAIIFSIFLGFFLSSKALKPVSIMIDQVESMDAKDFSKRIDTSKLSMDEIGKLAETFNRLLERISESVKSQNRFISDASHELRSPLTAIIGHAELLQKRAETNPEILKKSGGVIIREAERLKRLVNDMLFLARSGSKYFEPQIVNLSELVKNTYHELKPIYPKLQLSEIISSLVVEGDSDALKRVLINLINNALVVIDNESGIVRISLLNTDNFAELIVEDNGSGIDEEHLPHIFERFYRSDSARERNKGGSGLGLSIVDDIVKIHNGTIEVKSKIREGTTFIIRLPLTL